MIQFIYSKFIINIAYILFKLASLFNSKAKNREGQWKSLLNQIPEKKRLRILVHASSMGEFEQAKPIINLIKKNKPTSEIIASFFSPSGYDNQKNYEFIDYALYLPIDTRRNAEKFVNIIEPDVAIFVRYEFWLNVLSALKKSGAKNYLVCATKPSGKLISKTSLGSSFLKICLNQYDKIFTTGIEHTNFFKSLIPDLNLQTLSDTRADRILEIVSITAAAPVLPANLIKDAYNFIAGSSWEKDEMVISRAVEEINKDKFKIRIIYVPHEPNESNLKRIEGLHNKTLRLSEFFSNNQHDLKETHLIVDSIGKLLKMYASADFAMVGCGFGDGVHSVSEPAGYGIPICCGPNIESMPDAVELRNSGGLEIINNSSELINWLMKMIYDESNRQQYGRAAKDYIISKAGSSEIICKNILNDIKL